MAETTASKQPTPHTAEDEVKPEPVEPEAGASLSVPWWLDAGSDQMERVGNLLAGAEPASDDQSKAVEKLKEAMEAKGHADAEQSSASQALSQAAMEAERLGAQMRAALEAVIDAEPTPAAPEPDKGKEDG